jgi:hypothetical protein
MANLTSNFTNLTTRDICPFTEPSIVKTASKVLAYTIIMIVGLVGNIVLCLVVYKNKNLRKPIDYLIVNIAVSDLAIPTLAITRNISALLTGSDVWRVTGAFGDFLCKVVFFLCDICPVVSVITLVFLTASRFAAVVFPFQASTASTNLKPKYFIGSTWIIAIVFFSPYFYTLRLGPNQKCQVIWEPYLNSATASKVFGTIIITTFILIPFVLTTAMYTVILHRLRKRTRGVPNQNVAARKKREKSTRNMTLLSFFIVVSFGLCWVPFFSALIIEHFHPNISEILNQCQWATFVFMVQYLAYSNTAVNPLFCLVFIRNYRMGLRKLSFHPHRDLDDNRSRPTNAISCTHAKRIPRTIVYCTAV